VGAKATGRYQEKDLTSGTELVPATRLLLRKLVARAAKDHLVHDDAQRENDPSQVLIDVHVDGVHCRLVRDASPSPTAVALSPRETEIARMIAKGYPNKSIAAVLEISSWTVGTHLRRIYSKLHVSSRAAMVAHLMNAGSLEQVVDSNAANHQPGRFSLHKRSAKFGGSHPIE